MREIQALDPIVDPDQTIRLLAHPPPRQCPKLQRPRPTRRRPSAEADCRSGAHRLWAPYAAFLQNPIHSHPNTRGCTPGWSAVPRWGTPMNDRRHCPGLAGYSNGIIYGLIPGRYGNPKWMIDVLVPGWWGSRSRNCPNGATHTSPGQLPGIHIADHKKLLAWIIIRPIGGVAPTAQEFPVPLSIQPEA